jgi:hypothetical protein
MEFKLALVQFLSMKILTQNGVPTELAQVKILEFMGIYHLFYENP